MANFRVQISFLAGDMPGSGVTVEPYLVTSLISRVCRSRFLRGSKLSQIKFWLALTATPLQRQREHRTSRTCSGAHPPNLRVTGRAPWAGPSDYHE